jgi:ATP-binding cassette subfamily C protein
MVATAGTVLLCILTLLTDLFARAPSKAASRLSLQRDRIGEDHRRKAEVIRAMGMTGAMTRKWTDANKRYLASHQRLSDVGGGFSTISKISRIMLQSVMLALGAYLVIQNEASAGVIIAGSILISRALAPVELAIAHWKGFVAARQSWRRLNGILVAMPQRDATMPLPKPSASLSAKGIAVAAPGGTALLIQDVSFALKSGETVGIIGPSGSGKSTLARAIIDVWPPARGKVRIDGASLDQWEPDALGRYIGYLPQTSELFSGTIAENISRFAEDPDANAIIAAARAAGVHDLILTFEKGYDTNLGPHGTMVSAGQQQRIGLARALYGDPFLIVLDEPNSNLDAEGEVALMRAIAGAKARGAIVLIIAHSPSAIAGVDYLLIMNQGRMIAFGPADDIAAKHLRPPASGPSLKVIQESGRPA